MILYWICETALLAGCIAYAYTKERRENFGQRMAVCAAGFFLLSAGINLFLGAQMSVAVRTGVRLLYVTASVLIQYFCWKTSWSAAIYQSIWAVLSWQLLFELWMGGQSFFGGADSLQSAEGCICLLLVFLSGGLLLAATIARWIPEGIPGRVGPRQLCSAVLVFGIFELLSLLPGSLEMEIETRQWQTIYLSQLLLAVVLYLQNELFKKSAMRQELAVMNLLWEKEQAQYRLSKENIALINQKCHDLKHQIRAIRSASREDIDAYLAEMEEDVRIYEAIVKTGNEVLDTILTEKSLYCKERGIVVSCVADGSQMEFIHTIDLYAILGNALDNAIEAVEKFELAEKRQIDVLIYRQQNFLVMNIINPIKENLVFEEDLPLSTKKDGRFHGFGLRSIRYMVKKYDGYVSVGEEDGCFSLKILIPVPAEK